MSDFLNQSRTLQSEPGLLTFPTEDVETSIPDRFKKIVQRYPDRLAVKAGERALTYDEWNRSANRIAHAIAASRPHRGYVVAVLFELGIDAVSAILGVLKSGNIYVALDPSFPRERLKDIVDDSQACLIVSNSRHQEIAQDLAGAGCSVINVDLIDQSADSDFEASYRQTTWR